MDLSTSYLGLRLKHPFMVGASPLVDHLDTVKRIEDGGSAAIVLHSLFEEQITLARTGRIHHIDPLDQQLAGAVADFPVPERYAIQPDEYLELVRKVKSAVAVPVIASLNGMTAESWLTFARAIEDAGADALELNMYEMVTDPGQSAAAIETQIRNIVLELKRALRIPLAVKLSPFFTAFGHFARQLDRAGADGLVLFNRFYEPDVDIRTLTVLPTLQLSTSSELLLRLQWAAVLYERIHASIAVTGGVATPTDGIKAILAGATAVQLVSAILRNGPAYIETMRDELTRWLATKSFASVAEARGRVSVARSANPAMFERAQYIRTLQSWAAG